MAAAATTRVPPSRVLLVASFGAFLAFLDATIVNVAFPSIRESFPGTTIGEPLVGPQRLQHRLRGVPDRLRPAHRPARTTPRVRHRRRRVHRRLGAVRRRALGRAAGRRPGGAGARRRDAGAGLARPRRGGVPRGAPRPRHRSLGRHRCRRRRARARRWAVPWSSSAAGAGRSSSTSRSGWPLPGSARRELVESRAPGRRTMPDLRGAALLAAALAAAQPRHRQGQRLGVGQPGRCSSRSWPPPCCWRCSCVSSRRHRSPLLDPALLRIRSFSVASAATRWPGSASTPTC